MMPRVDRTSSGNLNADQLERLIRMRSQMQEAQPWMIDAERFVRASLRHSQGLKATMSSDYGGTDRSSDFLTFSYLLSDAAEHGWDELRTAERSLSGTFDRRLSYKRFRPRAHGPQLDWWLDATRRLSGEIFVFAFSKEVVRNLQPIRPGKDFSLRAKWKPDALEDAVRKALLGGMLIAHKLQDFGQLEWITDQDPAVSNPDAEADFVKIGAILSDMFSPLNRRGVSFGTTASDCVHMFREDMNSIADLAAGMVAEILTAIRRGSSKTHVDFSTISERCATVAEWFWRAQHGPRRLCLVIDNGANGRPEVSAFQL